MKSLIPGAFASLLLLLVGCTSNSFIAKETLAVDSHPAGAEVWIKGDLMGHTPTKLELVSMDIHELEFRRTGFKTQKVTVYSDLSENAKTGFRVNPLVTRGYYSRLSPNPVEVELVSTLVPDDENAPKTWEEFSSRLNELDSWLTEGKVSQETHRVIKRQLIDFYE